MVVALAVFARCGAGSVAPLDVPAEPEFDSATATAVVSGQILFEGTPPALPRVTIGGDPLCRENIVNIRDHEAVTTADGKVRNVIVYVRSGFEGRHYKPPSEPVLLDQQGCIYMPHAVTLMKGQKLRIRNSDETFHNVHAQTDEQSEFNIGQGAKGVENLETFSRAVMPYHIGCDLHRWMHAYAGVFEHPFHMATGETGAYELHLPPGKYEIVAWHDKLGEQASTLEVAGNSQTTLDFRFKEPGK